MDVRWNDVIGYEGVYQVSNTGLVRSVDRVLRDGRRWKGRVLSPKVDRDGYLEVNLSFNNKIRMFKIHHLVLDTFLGKRPDAMECRHLDGNPSNNRIENICWGTSVENSADRVRHGTDNKGEKSGKANLCDLDVWLIRNCKISGAALGKFFGVSESQVSNIRLRKSWTHI